MAGASWLLAAVFVGPATNTSGEWSMLGRWPRPTLGGLQDWADIHLFRDWRIQANVVSGGFRLLDGWNFAHATGTEAECRRRLAQIRAERQWAAPAGKAVLLLHGMANVRYIVEPLARKLRDDGFDAYTVTYPSTRLPIERHADALRRIIAELDAREIHLVGHSMGGLVIRAYLTVDDPDQRVRRVVMLGTPNRGAAKADYWRDTTIYKRIYGPAGGQLTTDPAGLPARLPPIPSAIEVGIIAGGTSDGRGFWSPIPGKGKGDGDGTVEVESTLMPGARDFTLVYARHSGLPFSSHVKELTRSFLRHGYFRSERERRPIAAANADGTRSVPATTDVAVPSAAMVP